MLRLPSPFNTQARQNSISAAGGGSTSTTCSCCIVSLAAACITTAVHFAGLAKPQVDSAPLPDAATENTPEPSVIVANEMPIAAEQTNAASGSGNAVGLALLGLVAIPMAAGVGIMFASGGGEIVGIAAGIGVWVGLFAAAYSGTKRSIRRGVITAIVGLIALFVIGFLEVFLWLGR